MLTRRRVNILRKSGLDNNFQLDNLEHLLVDENAIKEKAS
jgi:hypothetical protein